MHWPVPDPIAFSAFGIDVRWYGVLIACSVLVGLFLACRRAAQYRLPKDAALDSLLIALPMAIVGARMYYVLFRWDQYRGDIAGILNLRGGGLAVHGGLLLGALGLYLYCRWKKVSLLTLLDLYAPSVALGQAIGRWGNFFNQEAHGGPTNLPWAIEVQGEFVHPTFLYESVWCFCLSIFLIWFSKKQEFSGQIFLLYGMLYSAERFLVEGLRTDSLMLFETLKMAQVLSLTLFVLFGILYAFFWKKAGRSAGTGERENSL